jgi:hypothetical protein
LCLEVDHAGYREWELSVCLSVTVLNPFYRQNIYPQNHTDPIQKSTGVDQQDVASWYPEFCYGSTEIFTGLVAAKHLNGKTGQRFFITKTEDGGVSK